MVISFPLFSSEFVYIYFYEIVIMWYNHIYNMLVVFKYIFILKYILIVEYLEISL